MAGCEGSVSLSARAEGADYSLRKQFKDEGAALPSWIGLGPCTAGGWFGACVGIDFLVGVW
jgi:hypothetical protein